MKHLCQSLPHFEIPSVVKLVVKCYPESSRSTPKHWIVRYSKRDHNHLHWPTYSHVLLLRTTTSFLCLDSPIVLFSIAPFDRSEWINPLDPRKWVSSPHADQTCPTYWDNISPKMWCQFCFLVTSCDPQQFGYYFEPLIFFQFMSWRNLVNHNYQPA